MSEQLKYIVDGLNEAPYNKNLNLIRYLFLTFPKVMYMAKIDIFIIVIFDVYCPYSCNYSCNDNCLSK